MAINIPNIDTSSWGDFSDILQNIIKNRQTALANEQLNKYRQGELKVAQQKEAREAELNPYYKQYYGAQAQHLRSESQKLEQERQYKKMLNSFVINEMQRVGLLPGGKKQINASVQTRSSNQPSIQNVPNANPNPNINNVENHLVTAQEQPNRPEISPAVAALIKSETGYDYYAQTPEQKAATEAKKQSDIAESKANIKTGQTITNSARDLVGSLNLIRQAKEIIKNHPGNTGWGQGLLVKSKKSKNEYANKLNTLFGEIQGKTSRLYNPRGGIGTINWAKDFKGSVFGSDEANLAMLDAMEEGAETTLKQYQEEHQDLLGKPLSIKTPKKSEKITKWIMKDGELVKE